MEAGVTQFFSFLHWKGTIFGYYACDYKPVCIHCTLRELIPMIKHTPSSGMLVKSLEFIWTVLRYPHEFHDIYTVTGKPFHPEDQRDLSFASLQSPFLKRQKRIMRTETNMTFNLLNFFITNRSCNKSWTCNNTVTFFWCPTHSP